jgi:hypothetical protein
MPVRPPHWLTVVAAALGLVAQAGSAPATISSTALGAGRYQLSVELPPVEVVETWIDGRLQHEFLVEGAGWIGRPGAPDLPSLQRLIGLPDRSDVRLTLLGGQSYELEGLAPLPCQERFHDEHELPLPWLEDAELYGTDAFFPTQPWELGEPALLRNRRVAQAAFQPVQVNPVTGEARIWTRMDFELSFGGQSRINVREAELAVGGTALDRAINERIFDPADPQGALRTAAFDPGRLPGKYIVFGTTTALASSSLQALLDWKRRKGHEVVTVSNSEISWTTTGIRNRIIDEYNSDHPVAFVLLVGDTDGSYALPTDNTALDHFYAMIDGGDILGDVAVGRLSADNATQLATVCNKILGYESDPYTVDDTWLNSAGFTVGSGACYVSMKILSRAIAAEMVERRGYTEIDTAWCAGSSHVEDWFVDGISFYSYRGWLGMEGLSTSTVLGLSQGPRTPVATIFTCSTGDFHNSDDFTEAFLRAGSPAVAGGAVACMGLATSSTHTRYNNVLVGGYYGGLLEHDLPEVGPCLLQGKYELYFTLPPSEQSSAANFAYWANLMGDPGTPQWAGSLGTLSASLPASLPLGTNHLELSLSSGGQPVSDVAVCAYQAASGLQVVALSDAAGQVLLPLEGLQGGQLQITATHHRYRPLLHTATVAQAAAEVALQTWSVGGDGRLTAGGAAEALTLSLRNTGSTTLHNLLVSAELEPGDGSVSGGPLYHASLAPGATQAFGGITLSGAASLVDGHNTPLRIQVQTSQGSFTRLADLRAASAALALNATAFPNGHLVPGAAGLVRLTLGNAGSLAGTSISALLVSEDEDQVTVLSGPQALGNLAPGASASADFSVELGPLVNPGQTLPLRLDWNAGAAQGGTPVPVLVGDPAAGDPSGPDPYGYWAYEDLDHGYLLAPTFSWYAISAPEGGPGTEVPLNDNGNEQDDGSWVDLPFLFTYYGQVYDRALVCSNGFVAFDENGFGEWDFRNHAFPTAMGPDAMIAPMWDDHLTTGASAGAWTWYDASQDAFVISWVNLPANSSGGPNSFQLVLYDPAVHETATGDGPFKFQYLVFNDNQSAYADFPHCSVGFKDHTSTVGKTLLNFNQYAPTMHPIANGRAIYVSTSIGEFIDTFPPAISIAPVGMVQPGEAVELAITVSDHSGVDWVRLHRRIGAGSWQEFELASGGGNLYLHTVPGQSLGTVVQYWVEARDLAPEPNTGQSGMQQYTVTAGTPPSGPDGHGYLIYDSADGGEGPAFSWIDISGLGQQLSLGDDATTTVSMPFDFIYHGQSYNQISVCSNGFIVAGSSSFTSFSNAGLASGNGAPLMICPFWDDLNPNSGGQVRVHHDAAQHRVVVSWIDVPRYGTSDNQRFQVVIHDPAWWPTVSGDSPVLMQYDLVGNSTSCTVGHQNAGRNDGIQYLYNGTYETNAAPLFTGQALWLTTGQPVLVPVTDLQAGVVGSQVQLSWTDTGAPSYRIYSDTEGYGAFPTLLGSTDQTQWSVAAVAGGRYFQVRSSAQPAALSALPRPLQVLSVHEVNKNEQ